MSEILHGELVEERAELATVQQQAPALPTFFSAMRPTDKVAFATEVANALRPILDKQGLVKHLNKKNPDDEYIELEGWQTCAALCSMSAKVEWTKKLENGKGYEARAVVIRTDSGIEIGAGESECSRDEWKWKERDDYAIKGMAQTRAQSRALRGVLAWVLVLAGYKPTPAEEMPDFQPSKAPRSVSTPADDPNTTRRMTGAVEGIGDGPIEISDRAKLNTLVGDGVLARFEIEEVVGEVLRDGRCSLPDIETKAEGREVYKALKAAKERARTEIPL